MMNNICENYKNNYAGVEPGSACGDCFVDIQDWSDSGICTECVKSFPNRGNWKSCGDHCKICHYSFPGSAYGLKQSIEWAKQLGREDELPPDIYDELHITEACTYTRS